MLDSPDINQQPPSHYEYVLKLDNYDLSSPIKNRAFAYMDQLEGWCSYKKASILMDIVLKTKPQKILEIGVYGGKSLVPMAYALKVNGSGIVYGIDPWDTQASLQYVANESNIAYWGWLDHLALMNGLINKITLFDLENEIQLIRTTSEKADLIYDIDILHVDGNHSDNTSYLDVTKWVPLMKKGGWIIFDDMTWHENGKYTTARAVDWLNEHCIKIAQFKDNCEWGIWVKL